MKQGDTLLVQEFQLERKGDPYAELQKGSQQERHRNECGKEYLKSEPKEMLHYDH